MFKKLIGLFSKKKKPAPPPVLPTVPEAPLHSFPPKPFRYFVVLEWCNTPYAAQYAKLITTEINKANEAVNPERGGRVQIYYDEIK